MFYFINVARCCQALIATLTNKEKTCSLGCLQQLHPVFILHTKDPPLYILVKVPHCIGQLALLTLSLIIWRMMVGKRERLSCYCPGQPLYIEVVTMRAIFSLSMLEHVQSIHEHSTVCTLWSLWYNIVINSCLLAESESVPKSHYSVE
jgi:hypothetical protein